jgi:Protein of unknown function (DUF2630)
MEDRDILTCIHALVAQERQLRDLRDNGQMGEGLEHDRLAEIGRNLDQMWDLLRRRRAMRAAGVDPDTINLRSSVQASVYVQ